MIHNIQKHILKTLTLLSDISYSKLKPKLTEGNLFVYHLRKLINEGYIDNKNQKYRLTSKGESFVDRVSLESFQERIQPKIVTLLCIEKSGEFLLYRRSRSPFTNHIGFPYGKIHMGEKLKDSAIRELKEKTGLKSSIKYKGHVYVTVHKETELISQMLFHVFYGKNPEGELKSDSLIGECFWGKIKDIPQQDLIPGVSKILKLIKKSQTPFFAEYFLNI